MKIKNKKFGSPDPIFVAGINGKSPCPFSDIEFMQLKKDGETTLQRIGSEEFNMIVDSVEQTGLKSIPEVMDVFNYIMSLEKKYKSDLEELAIDTVVKNFGLPMEVRDLLEAYIETDDELNCDPNDEDEEDDEEINLSKKELKIADDLIKRRIIQNALMMGSGYRAHKLFSNLKESLDKIDKKLFPLYESVLPSIEFYLWKYEIPVQQRLNWGKCEIIDTGDEIKGQAKAKIFIILLHEVAKIAVELLFLQSLQDIQDQYGEEMKRYVIKKADRYEDEQWMKLIGPPLWKHLHECMDYIVKSRNNDYTVVSYLLNTIGILYPENFFLVINMVVNDGAKAIEFLEEIYEQIMTEIEMYKMEEEETNKTKQKRTRKSNHKKAKTLSECSIDELNLLLNNAVETEEFERAAVIKKEIDKR